jgi:plastocyanin/mono/diheme cytochrome c family protein
VNTSKQVNVIIGLLFVGALATLLYFLWDGERQSDATERQMTENAERGGFLFARNCSSCHGLTGTGVQERGGLPGAPLNVEANRETDAGNLGTLQARLRDTIHCGRVGTLMPPWSQEQGGPLNDFQIQQLVALITGTMPPSEGTVSQDDILDDPNAISEEGWHNALETANHDSEFDPPKELEEAVDAEATTLTLNDASGISPEALLRIDDDPEDGVYELVIVSEVNEDDNEIEVERGAEGSDAAEHEAGAHVFNGPALPGTTITGDPESSGFPPCGQSPAQPQTTPGPPVAVSGTVSMTMGDNFFELQGQRNPSLSMAAGQTVTFQLTNSGSAPHNMRTTGPDAEFDTDDDTVSDPATITGGATGTLAVSFAAAGTYEYHCEFHPDQMVGEITVTQ